MSTQRPDHATLEKLIALGQCADDDPRIGDMPEIRFETLDSLEYCPKRLGDATQRRRHRQTKAESTDEIGKSRRPALDHSPRHA